MKQLRERILALGMALCLCLSLCAVPASAADKEKGDINLTVTLSKKPDGSYTASYSADTVMVDWLAKAAALNRNDEEMKNLRFTCTLTDALTKKLSSSDIDKDSYVFTSAKFPADSNNSIFILVDDDEATQAVTVSEKSIKLRYKLNPDVLTAWENVSVTAEDVHDLLVDEVTGKMTMKATRNVPVSALSSIGSSAFKTTARIDITMKNNGAIPALDGITSIFAAYGERSTNNPEYSGGGGGGGGGGGSVTPAKPTVEVVDKTPSVTKPTTVDPTTGEPTTGELPPAETVASYLPVGGGTTTVENPNAKPGEDVHVKTESDKGSMVNYITVKDENGNRIPVTYDGKGKFSFEMPESGNVTIEANYRTIPADPKETGVAELLNTKDHILYMIGDDKGDFRPNASISRAEVATAFFRLLNDQNVARTQHFDDVKTTDWYAQPVEVLAALHIIEGIGTGDYQPNRPITRAEFAAVAARFANELTTGTSFADVGENEWYADFVSTAASFGWINGVGNGNYEPNRPITRTEAAAIINRMLMRISDWIEVDAGHGRQFPDVDENFWGRYEISEATNGHDHTLEEEYFHEDWLAEDWREAVDNDPVNFGQPKF